MKFGVLQLQVCGRGIAVTLSSLGSSDGPNALFPCHADRFISMTTAFCHTFIDPFDFPSRPMLAFQVSFFPPK